MAAPPVAVGLQDFGEVRANWIGEGGLEVPGVLAILPAENTVQTIAPNIVLPGLTLTLRLVQGGPGESIQGDDSLEVYFESGVVQL